MSVAMVTNTILPVVLISRPIAWSFQKVVSQYVSIVLIVNAYGTLNLYCHILWSIISLMHTECLQCFVLEYKYISLYGTINLYVIEMWLESRMVYASKFRTG